MTSPTLPNLYDRMVEILADHLPKPIAIATVNQALHRAQIERQDLPRDKLPENLQSILRAAVVLTLKDQGKQQACMARINALAQDHQPSPADVFGDSEHFDIEFESDIVIARTRARETARKVGFKAVDQIKIATAVSELARNIFRYVGRGRIELHVSGSPKPGLQIVAMDQGPGIPHIERILSGDFESQTGMGMGILGSKRLMDHFDVITGPNMGTRITATKHLR